MIKFEWNSRKAKSNETKHKVSFEEAQSVFFDEYAQQFYDSENSDDEDRFFMLGTVSYTHLTLPTILLV